MENEPAVLHSFAIDNRQFVKVVDPALAKQLIGSDQLGWVLLDGTNPSAPAILETHSATLDRLTIDALFCGLLFAIMLIQIWIFRLLKWL